MTEGPVRIVGTGLLGTSIGLGLRALGIETHLDDVSPGTLALASDFGAGTPMSLGQGDPKLIVVAAPPDVVAQVVADQLRAYPKAMVTDVASVKAGVLHELQRGGLRLARYVGSHPMAGREHSGPAAGRSDLFLGRPWVIAPHDGADRNVVAALKHLSLDLGAVPVVLDAVEHDEAVALVSHVPQIAASLVAMRLNAAPDDDVLSLAGQGVRDVTRIAASDPGLWVEILAGNAGPVAALLKGLRDDLDPVIAALESLDKDDQPFVGARSALARLISDGRKGQSRIPGKHGSAAAHYETVIVMVPDRPGELGRLFAEIGDAGINLEDLRLEHSLGQQMGLAHVSVDPAHRAQLESELENRGWKLAAS